MSSANDPTQISKSIPRINELEESLKLMKSRIEYLLKSQQKNQRDIKETFKSSLHHIEHKMIQTEYNERLRKQKQKHRKKVNKQHGAILEYKQKQTKQLNRIKQTMKDMKRKESQNIKKQSQLNDGIIKENRRKIIEAKKQNVQKIKQIREQTKNQINRKIVQDRQQYIQNRRIQKFDQKIKKSFIIEDRMKGLRKVEKILRDQLQQSQTTSNSLQKIAGDARKIPERQFYKIIREVKKDKPTTQQDIKIRIFQKLYNTSANFSPICTLNTSQTNKQNSKHSSFLF